MNCQLEVCKSNNESMKHSISEVAKLMSTWGHGSMVESSSQHMSEEHVSINQRSPRASLQPRSTINQKTNHAMGQSGAGGMNEPVQTHARGFCQGGQSRSLTCRSNDEVHPPHSNRQCHKERSRSPIHRNRNSTPRPAVQLVRRHGSGAETAHLSQSRDKSRSPVRRARHQTRRHQTSSTHCVEHRDQQTQEHQQSSGHRVVHVVEEPKQHYVECLAQSGKDRRRKLRRCRPRQEKARTGYYNVIRNAYRDMQT